MTSPLPDRSSWLSRRVPNIRPGFPSGGEILAPAWSRCWGLLNDMAVENPGFRGMTIRELADALSAHPTTLGNLLRAAVKAGLVETSDNNGDPLVHPLAKLYRVRPNAQLTMHDHYVISPEGKVSVHPAHHAVAEPDSAGHRLMRVQHPRQAFRR